MKQELLKGLTEEQIAKVKACKNQEEILAIAKQEGIELTDEQLEAVSGGSFCASPCPKCGTADNVYVCQEEGPNYQKYVCTKCGTVVDDFGL